MEFLEDENGQQQVIDLIHDIVTKTQTDKNYREMAKRIAQVFQHLKTTGLPPEHLSTINAKSTNDFTITLVDIVKELTEYKPLLERRINWKPVGAFRALFFYEEDSRGNQIIYYTKAVIKTSTFSQDFEDIAAESENMMKEFYTN